MSILFQSSSQYPYLAPATNISSVFALVNTDTAERKHPAESIIVMSRLIGLDTVFYRQAIALA
jgi:hypothetical protein